MAQSKHQGHGKAILINTFKTICLLVVNMSMLFMLKKLITVILSLFVFM